MASQLKLNFDDNCIEEAVKEDCLYNWCKENNREDILADYNDSFSVKGLTYGSNRHVKWKCHVCGYEWTDSVGHRTTANRGCKLCNRKKNALKYSTVKDINDSVLTKFPEVAKEWSPKNERGPETYYPSSNKKIIFVCGKCGVEWKTTVYHRCIRNSGCPTCSHYKIVSGINDLCTTNPEIMSEWDFEKNTIDPHTISYGSHEKAHWICGRGHRWSASIYSRVHAGNGCPKCAQEKRTSLPEKVLYFYIKKYCSDAIENYRTDFLGKQELDIYIPSHNIGIEYDGKAWHKDVAKDLNKDNLCIENNIELIRIREEGCPIYKSPSKLIFVVSDKNNYNYLESALCEIFKMLSIYDYSFDIDKDINEIMANYLSLEKENSIAKDERLIKEWDFEKNKYINPEFISLYSNRKFWWKCNICGYSWCSSPAHRARGHGCLACANQVVVPGKNDLESQYPDLAKEWDYELNDKKPSEVTAHNNKKYHWICKNCGHKWFAVVDSRTRGCDCPKCKNKKISAALSKASKNESFGMKYPNLLDEWDYDKNDVSPFEIYPSSNLKVNWKCKKCGNSWPAVLYSRTKNKTGCPYCTGRFAMTGVNDLATLYPELLKEWDYEKNTIDPTKEKAGSGKKAFWKCSTCGHEWQAIINVRTQGCGCPKCGFKKSSNALKRKVVCIETGIIYDSLTEAAKSINMASTTSVSNCLKGRCYTAGGYHWKYYEE